MVTKKRNLITKIGMASLLVGPFIFVAIPLFFTNSICGSELLNGCGYANAGIVGYMVLFSLPFLVVGIALLIIALFSKNKQ